MDNCSMMRYITCIILFLGVIFFLSCDKDTTERYDESVEIELREGDLREHRSCFSLVFPVGVIFPDRTKVRVGDEEEMRQTIKRWYDSNSRVKERPGLSYPVDVRFENGKTKMISSAEDMEKLKAYCKDKHGKVACFNLMYPYSYTMPDGSTISGEHESELNAQLKAWYEANPKSMEKPQLVYPVDIILKNGDIITIESEDEMIIIKKRCTNK